MKTRNLTLMTDLYELTMMQGYFKENNNETVVFDVFYRNNPCGSGYAIAAGLEQIIDYIQNLQFTYHDICLSAQSRYLRRPTFWNICAASIFPGTCTRFRKAPSYSQTSL